MKRNLLRPVPHRRVPTKNGPGAVFRGLSLPVQVHAVPRLSRRGDARTIVEQREDERQKRRQRGEHHQEIQDVCRDEYARCRPFREAWKGSEGICYWDGGRGISRSRRGTRRERNRTGEVDLSADSQVSKDEDPRYEARNESENSPAHTHTREAGRDYGVLPNTRDCSSTFASRFGSHARFLSLETRLYFRARTLCCLQLSKKLSFEISLSSKFECHNTGFKSLKALCLSPIEHIATAIRPSPLLTQHPRHCLPEQ
jgi:hypothetical protein